jgi:hypothetical protein
MRRARIRQVFWVDLNKPEQAWLAERIVELKSQKSFARTVREGIRLVCDLRQGKTDVLRELFPWVLEQDTVEKEGTDRQTPAPAEDSTAQLIARLEALIAEREQAKPTFTPLAPVAPSPPKDDEIELEIKQDSSGSRSAYNLIQQLNDMQAKRGAWGKAST